MLTTSDGSSFTQVGSKRAASILRTLNYTINEKRRTDKTFAIITVERFIYDFDKNTVGDAITAIADSLARFWMSGGTSEFEYALRLT